MTLEAGAEEALPDELVITLRKPVSLGDITYDRLVLREPTAAEMLLCDKLTGAEADIVMTAMVSGMPRPAVEKIGVRDLLQASRYLARFLD